MAVFEISPARPAAGATLARPVELVCIALIFAHAVYLVASYGHGSWLVAPDGSGVPSDFVAVWAAGRLALDGSPAAAYHWPTHKIVEVLAVGREFVGYFGWHYPPAFLFAAAALAFFPYAAAYLIWLLATFPIYLAAMRAIVGSRDGYLLAAAFPAVLANCVVGQNGFLTAGLIGGCLMLIERKPVAAGILLGLLTYKPHLGLLFPVALAAAGHWRAFTAAAVTATVLAALSWHAFGGETWQAFFASISQTSQAFLSDGWADWSKLQTTFGLVRTLGGGETLAWLSQGAVALLAAIVIALLWRQALPFEIKAAALATGAMLATPYLYTYDLVVLAVPLAFLFRLGRTQGFLVFEMTGIGLACVLVLIFPFVKAPVGLAAVLVVALLIARRLLAAKATAT